MPDAVLVDVRAEGVPDAILAQAFEVFGDKLLNTRSTTWRQLDEDARRMPPLELIKATPSVMKRPLIAVDNQLFLGWTTAVEADVKASL